MLNKELTEYTSRLLQPFRWITSYTFVDVRSLEVALQLELQPRRHLRHMFISAIRRTVTSGGVAPPVKRLISVRVIYFIDLAVIQPLDWH